MFFTVKIDHTASHVILGVKTGKPPFYFQDVGKPLWTSVQLTILLQNKKTKPRYKKHDEM